MGTIGMASQTGRQRATDGEAGTTVAERSTAAVDVADNSGDEPLTAEAVKATADGVDTQNDRAADGSMRETDGERRTAAPVAAPELHSGHKLARRYRLEECVTRLDGFSSWRAMDEKLRRAVGVHLLPADHPRARTVLSAARSSALLGDPRFVQVLDAVEENDLVYVVHEWLPDATELTALLAVGPLEAHEAYQLVSQVSQAMAAAHREGLAHLRLTPSAILRTSTGQYRIRGLAVNAALRGITSDTPQQADTEAIGALLYAALTQRWPYETDAYGLTGLPKGVGLIAPDQVRAACPPGSGRTGHARAGQRRGHRLPAGARLYHPGGAGQGRRRDAPHPAAGAGLHRPARVPAHHLPAGELRLLHPATGLPTVQSLAVPPPPPLQSRTGRALKWGVAALLIAALGLGSWQLADALLDRKHGGSGNSGSTPQTKSDEAPKEIKPGKPLRIGKATVFGKDPIKPGDARKAIDGDADTGWVTLQFRGFANFGNLDSYDDGSGIIVDLGSAQDVAGLEVGLHASGQKIEVRAASPEAASARSLSDFPQEIVKLGNTGKNLNTTLQTPVKTRFLLIHITSLPSEGGDSYRGGINEIKVLGTAE